MQHSLERMRYRGVLIKMSLSSKDCQEGWKLDVRTDDREDQVVVGTYSSEGYREAALKAARKLVKQLLRSNPQKSSFVPVV